MRSDVAAGIGATITREVLPILGATTSDATPIEIYGVDLEPKTTVTISIDTAQWCVAITHEFVGACQMLATASRANAGNAAQASNLAGSGNGAFGNTFQGGMSTRPKMYFEVVANRFSLMARGRDAIDIVWAASLTITTTRTP